MSVSVTTRSRCVGLHAAHSCAADYWTHAEDNCGTQSMKDMWRINSSYNGPAFELANGAGCSQANQTDGGADARCTFEDELFVDEVVRILHAHDKASPLFLVWAMHLVHMPLQVPSSYLEALSFIDDNERRKMHAMTNFVDGMVGRVVDELKALDLWEDTLVVFHADNGGEIMLAGECGGNNWPEHSQSRADASACIAQRARHTCCDISGRSTAAMRRRFHFGSHSGFARGQILQLGRRRARALLRSDADAACDC
jgi:arylsulfatase A-like enzyme